MVAEASVREGDLSLEKRMETGSAKATNTSARDQAEFEKGGIPSEAENQRGEVRPCGGSEERQEEAHREEAQAKRQQERIHTRTPEWEEGEELGTHDKRKKAYEVWKENKKRDGRVEKGENGSEERETACGTGGSEMRQSDGMRTIEKTDSRNENPEAGNAGRGEETRDRDEIPEAGNAGEEDLVEIRIPGPENGKRIRDDNPETGIA